MATKTTKTASTTPAANGRPAPKGEVRWTPRRIAIVKALRQLKAFNADSARTVAEIAAYAAKHFSKTAPELGDPEPFCGRPHKGAYLTFVCLDQYKTNELVANGYATSVRLEGEKGLRFHLTNKGRTATLAAPKAVEKTTEKAAAE